MVIYEWELFVIPYCPADGNVSVNIEIKTYIGNSNRYRSNCKPTVLHELGVYIVSGKCGL